MVACVLCTADNFNKVLVETLSAGIMLQHWAVCLVISPLITIGLLNVLMVAFTYPMYLPTGEMEIYSLVGASLVVVECSFEISRTLNYCENRINKNAECVVN